MFPLRDTIRSRHFPIMNWLLLGANTLVFLFELSLGPVAVDRFIDTYALVPAHLFGDGAIYWLTLFTHMFLHGGWLHFISNMWTLFIFGDNVEDRMGPIPYLVFYLLSGVVAGLLQVSVAPGSPVAILGASGAIAGVLGAYMFLFPGARVVTLIPVFLFPWIVQIPAFFYLGFWFISQLFSGVASFGASMMGGIAWWAHIGGFLVGLFLGRYFLLRPPPPPPPPRYYRVPQSYPDDYPYS